MIQAGTDVAAGNGKARRVDERAHLYRKIRGCRFQRRFQIGSIEVLQPGKRRPTRSQPRFVLREKMFRDAFRIKFEIVPEEKTAVGRELIEYPELAFAGVERG